MFRRKKSESDDDQGLPVFPDELGIPMKPTARPPQNPPQAPMAAKPSAPSALPPQPLRPGAPTPPSAGAGAPLTMTPAPKPRDPEARKLTVGREISLSGEINSCDRLVVEGSVEANLSGCRDIEIAEGGLFKGSASI